MAAWDLLKPTKAAGTTVTMNPVLKKLIQKHCIDTNKKFSVFYREALLEKLTRETK